MTKEKIKTIKKEMNNKIKKSYPLAVELENHTGTTAYHKFTFFGGLNGTDGFVDFLQKAKCFWLGDIVGSVQAKPKIHNSSFIIWRIEKDKDGARVSAYSDCESDGSYSIKKRLYVQKMGYTDFPFDKIGNSYEFYQEGNVVLLKSEH